MYECNYFGATGGIRKQDVKHALEKGYHVTAYVRSKQKKEEKLINLLVTCI